MMGTISPVVYRGSQHGRDGWRIAAVAYTTASVLGASVIGILLGSVGSLLSTQLQEYGYLALGVLAIAYSLHEFQFIVLPHPERKRQVPEQWRRRCHPLLTAGLYGVLLGMGFTTHIPTTSYYFVALTATLSGAPVFAGFVFGLFGIARSTLIWPMVARCAQPHQVQLLINYMALTAPIVRLVNGFVLAMLGSFVLFTRLANI
ncbi:MAG: hypothetical protein KatS3mg053_0446 [Candidatus Roseilinea sp.]|nr:MAG: hypothetical protein KatS3mg053_0446 [Candidatus Roseilinea sp.]